MELNKIMSLLVMFLFVVSFASAIDSDLDGVYDHADLCSNTNLVESIPFIKLLVNRFALVNGDSIFDTVRRGNLKSTGFTTLDTCGCSCEQIIEYNAEETGYGSGYGHVKFGCSRSVIQDFADEYCHLVEDCNGELGGEADFDQCGVCTGGNTGVLSCVQDCNDVWGGDAYYDDCNTCVGGNTGKVECSGNCVDSDGGINFFEKGIVFNHSVTGTNLVDACITGTNYLFERHCVSDNPQNYTVFINCADLGMTCQNGACVDEPVTGSCEDSDGGVDFFEKGILTLSNDFSSGTLQDTCTGVGEGLAEYTCMPDGCGYQVVYPTELRISPEYMLVYDNGDCSYATTTFGYTANCATNGQVCQSGACVSSGLNLTV